MIGIAGAGQLARMMLQAAISLDLPVRLLAASPGDGAAQVWPDTDLGPPDHLETLRAFARTCDVLTFDHELIDPAHLRALEAAGATLRPSAAAAVYAQDKTYQRAHFAALGLPVPAHRPALSADHLVAFGAEHGWPLVAKARRGGYDGRGVWIVETPDAARDLHWRSALAGVELLAEVLVPIERELAVLVARRPGGEMRVYPVVETVQRDGICHEVIAPAPVSETLARAAEELGRTIAAATDVTGILAVELFVAGGALLINEVACRPHNSGHFSIEGCVTSQFENHLRAVADLPLGDTALRAPVVVMANVLGGPGAYDPRETLAAALSVPGVHVHLYGKEARPGRKLGHVTALGDQVDETRARATRAAAILAGVAGDWTEE